MKKDLIIKKLEDMGYRPNLDKDGDIAFMFQMKQLYLVGQSVEEDSYAVLYYPEFYDIAEGDEVLALTAANTCTRETKQVKYFVDSSMKTVSATCEFFFTEESIEFLLSKSLRLMGIVRTTFMNKLRELETAANSDDESGEDDGGEDDIIDIDAEEVISDADTNNNENNSDNEIEI